MISSFFMCRKYLTTFCSTEVILSWFERTWTFLNFINWIWPAVGILFTYLSFYCLSVLHTSFFLFPAPPVCCWCGEDETGKQYILSSWQFLVQSSRSPGRCGCSVSLVSARQLWAVVWSEINSQPCNWTWVTWMRTRNASHQTSKG